MAAPPPSGRQLALSAHDQELVVVEVGGGIRSYRAGGVDVLDGYPEDRICDGGRGQLLCPWPNRTGDGAFEWEGRSHQLPLTEVEHHNAIHGLVRWSSWTLPDSTPGPWGPQTPVDSVSVAHRLHPSPGWAWTLDLRVTYRLSPAGLEVRTSARNEGPGRCPFGVGWHPYLAAFGGVVDDLTVRVGAATAYRSDERGLPTGRFPVAGSEVDFNRGRRVGADRVDACFTDLERDGAGRAVVEVGAGGRSVRLWLDSRWSHVMVYTGDTLPDPERRRRGLAVEPMTCPPDMLRSGDGRIVLEPGGGFEAAWGIWPFS